MASPFPGMDPFLENQEWKDFHTDFNVALRAALVGQIEPEYIVRVERRIYVEFPSHGDEPRSRIADAAILVSDACVSDFTGGSASMSEPSVATAVCELPMPEEQRETYLVIRDRETREIVTVIETLSPANKRQGDGRREYLQKRDEVLQSQAHLVELDLLRSGERLPMVTPLPPGDYYAIISRRHRRPKADVFAWRLTQSLPEIPIPLKKGEPEVSLQLQPVFNTVYDRARYDLSVDYQAPLDPPPSDTEAQWMSQLLDQRRPTG
jgi:hypothetical protein